MRGCACRGTAGFAHVSCLAEQAKILCDEAEENNLGDKAWGARWLRWSTCSLCEQRYHGVVSCALGWACWKTYVGRPGRDGPRINAMRLLGNGLYAANHYEDALSVQEAELSMWRRLGAQEERLLIVQTNLAVTYRKLGRREEALRMFREMYAARSRLHGPRHRATFLSAGNLSDLMVESHLWDEAKQLLREQIPLALETFGPDDDETLRMRWRYALVLQIEGKYTEAVAILEDVARRYRRVFGISHPMTAKSQGVLEGARGRLSYS